MSEQHGKVERFDNDREKAIIGGALPKATEGKSLMRAWVKALLDEHVTGEEDRALLRAKGWL